ncbi:hypothetical protein BDW71DRAFT_114463 [Aspergillus fruticulosus]
MRCSLLLSIVAWFYRSIGPLARAPRQKGRYILCFVFTFTGFCALQGCLRLSPMQARTLNFPSITASFPFIFLFVVQGIAPGNKLRSCSQIPKSNSKKPDTSWP